MKSLKEYLISEKLGYTNKVTLKICKAFGFTENDNLSDAIDKWVNDNKVTNVSFFINDTEELDITLPKSIYSLYSDDKNTLEKIYSSLKDNENEFAKEGGNNSWDTFTISGNDYVLAFNTPEGSLYAVNIK